MSLNARNIADALYLDRYGSDLVLAPSYTPRGWYECDIFALTKAGYAVEFEIKLSVSDFRADLKKGRENFHYDATAGLSRTSERKHDRLKAGDPMGPSRFFYVVPDGLIAATDVPGYAGLIVCRPRERHPRPHLITARPAPKLHSVKADAESIVRTLHGRLYHRYWHMRIHGPIAQDATAS